MSGRKYPYAECRSRMPGHSWQPYAGSDWIPPWGVGEEERCDRCGMERRAIIDRRGVKSQWAYVQPEGYKTDLDANELRLQVIRERYPSNSFRSRRAKLIPIEGGKLA